MYLLSEELNPSPGVLALLSSMLTIPSANTSSPTANGAVVNPVIGVAKKQVTIPAVLVKQLLIPIPLSLFSAKTKLVTSLRPTGVSNISISLIAAPCIFAFRTPVSYFVPSSGFISDKSGGEL